MPRPPVRSTVAARTLAPGAAATWEVRDATGTGRARVTVPPGAARREQAAVPVPRSRARLLVELPDALPTVP